MTLQRDLLGTFVSVLDDPDVAPALSLSTQVNLAAYGVTAFEVASMATSGAWEDLAAELAPQVVSMAINIVADIVPELVSGLSSGLPLAGALGSAIFAVVDAIDAAGAAEDQRRLAIAMQEKNACQQAQQANAAIPSGRAGAYMPCDFFDQSKRSGYAADGSPLWSLTDKVPDVGILLRLLTEHQWPCIGFTSPTVGLVRYGLDPIFAEAAWKSIDCQAPGFNPGTTRCTWGRPAADIVAPVAQTKYLERMRTLREAIQRESLGYRVPRGLSIRNGGRELWPLYMDLFADAVTRPRHIFGAASSQVIPRWFIRGEESPGPSAGSERLTSNEHLAAGFGRFLRQLVSVGTSYSAQLGWPHPAAWPTSSGDGLRFLASQGGWCAVDWAGASEQVIAMADQWLNTVRPIYLDDRVAYERAMAEAVAGFSAAAVAAIERTGAFKATTPRRRMDQLAGRLEDAGVMSATDARAAASPGLALGIGAAGALALGLLLR